MGKKRLSDRRTSICRPESERKNSLLIKYMRNRCDLSIVVPFLNEEESISHMYDAVIAAVEPLECTFEIIFVDDGSTDLTLAIARDLAANDPRLRVISFRRNYGQTPAMAAGIDHARGRVIVTMDGDLQNDPRDIGALLEKIDEGHDLVVGWRHNRKDKLISRKIPSIIANRLIGKVTGVPIKDNGCSLKAYRAEMIQNVPLYAEMHRFIPAMATIAGPRIAEIKVRHHARNFGTSKYGLSRVYKVLLDLLTIKTLAGFFSRPTIWFSLLGLPFAILGVVLSVATIFGFFGTGTFSIPLAGTGLLFVTLAIFLFFNGILGELVYKTGDTRTEDFARMTVSNPSHAENSAAVKEFSTQ
jgi:glycosyltransferase involved in cell wall biosynthesis